MADSNSFWYPDQPPPPKPDSAPLLTPEEREVVKESLQYFYSVYRNCGDVAIEKVKLIKSAAAALVIHLEEY